MAVRSNQEVSYTRVIANAVPVVHPILGSIPNKGTFPLPVTKTGTISSTPSSTGTENQKIVFGVGTAFLSEIREGDYLYAADCVRLIESVASDKQLTLREKLPVTISGVALKIVRPGKYKIILARNTGPVNAIYQEATFPTGANGVSVRENEMGLAPVSYDVSAATAEITFELSE